MMPYGPAYCSECRPIAEAELQAIKDRNAKKKAQDYNKKRDPKYLTFYRSKAWRDTSRAFLQSVSYQCQARLAGCTHLAVEVHHKKPIQTPEGWEKRLDWENLEAVCTACHNGRHPEKARRAAHDGVIDLQTFKN